MKKSIIIFSTLFITIFLSGCSLTGMETYSCTSTTTSDNGLTTKITYDITHSDDTVDMVKITYDYEQDDDDTIGNMVDDMTNMIDDDIDGMNADTDGNSDTDNDEVVDGVVGDTLDAIVNGVTDTIIDIAGLRERHNVVSDRYGDLEGVTITVDDSDEDSYKVVYDIDMAKISDDDLDIFNLDRSFETLKGNYNSLGLMCK